MTRRYGGRVNIKDTAGEEVRSGVHWAVGHGLPVLMLRRAASRGDLHAQLILAGSSTEDTLAAIERIRSAGPVITSRIGAAVTSHSGVREVLVSDDYRTGFPTGLGVLGKVVRWSAPRMLHPVEPPSLLVLGEDALSGYRSTLDAKRQVLDAWETTSLSTGFAD